MIENITLITVALILVCVLLVACPPRWDPALRLRERQMGDPDGPEPRQPGDPDRWMDFIGQARRDQQVTDYPGCCRGVMYCRSTVCGCVNESRPNDAFVRARARNLAREEDSK